jgi:recombination protein RecR
MNSIDKLIQIFSHFPGIGPRQARRFVYYLLTRNNGAIQELIDTISTLKKDVTMCAECKRFFEKKYDGATLCSICSDTSRDTSLLMIVPRDSDLESIEKNAVFNGRYFVLGGSIPILEKEPEKRIRSFELKNKIEKEKNTLAEIIIAMNFNPEGENTGEYVEKQLSEILKDTSAKISHLGKGLSMGTELEYADPETMRNALKNRT